MKSFRGWLHEIHCLVDNPVQNFEVDIVNYINAKGEENGQMMLSQEI